MYNYPLIELLELYPVAQAAYRHVISNPKSLLLNIPPLAVHENFKFPVNAFAKIKLNV